MTEIVTTNEIAEITQPPKPTFDDCLTVVIDGLRSESSKDTYRRSAKSFGAWLTQNERNFDHDSVLAYVAHLEREGKKPATINTRLAAIRAITKVAKIKEIMTAKSANQIIHIKSRKNAHDDENAVWLERGEITTVLEDLVRGGTNKDKRDACIIALAISSGLRRDELLNLKWSQVSRNGKVFLNNVVTKGEKPRRLLVRKWAVPYLDEWGEVTGRDGYIFVKFLSRRGERWGDDPLKRTAITKVVSKAGKAVGVALKPHDLRRTHAAMLYDAGKRTRYIQASLGHSSITTTEKYLKPIILDRLADDEDFMI